MLSVGQELSKPGATVVKLSAAATPNEASVRDVKWRAGMVRVVTRIFQDACGPYSEGFDSPENPF